EDGLLSDDVLLESFVRERDGAAFRLLLERHGGLVLAVARRLLRNDADAEDVFQATFLLLALRAGSLRRRASLACWLHGVAHRLSLKLRRQEARRRARERSSFMPSPRPEVDPVEAVEAEQVLLEE